MVRSLPAKPSLLQLRHQAKDLLTRLRAGDEESLALLRAHPRFARAAESPVSAAKLSLSDAQLVLAREYGFASWPKLKEHIEGRQSVEERVARLRAAYAAADSETRERLLSRVHTRERFQDYDPAATELTERDARLVIANEEGYAFWAKYESYLNLDPAVQGVIQAVRVGDLNKLRALLRTNPGAANPRWVRADLKPPQISNDSIPLHCVAEGVFNGTNRQGNDYHMTRALIKAGADVEIDNGEPLKSAVSYYAEGAVRALLEGGARVDGPDGGGMPIAYALTFGFTEIAELLDSYGAQLDLRFAAGLGKPDLVKSFVNPDGSRTPDAGRLADPFENRFRCERTRANILCQSLLFASLHARQEVVEYLLDRGADPNQEVPGTGPLGGTALHHVVGSVPLGATGDRAVYEERRLPIVELLLGCGASVTMRDSRFHSTPLGWANHFGAKRMCDQLAPHAGAHDAVRFGLVDRLSELLASDPARANARDELGQTPLHCLNAETPEALAIIAVLRANGADLGARDHAGMTRYDKAIAAGRNDLAEWLQLG